METFFERVQLKKYKQMKGKDSQTARKEGLLLGMTAIRWSFPEGLPRELLIGCGGHRDKGYGGPCRGAW